VSITKRKLHYFMIKFIRMIMWKKRYIERGSNLTSWGDPPLLLGTKISCQFFIKAVVYGKDAGTQKKAQKASDVAYECIKVINENFSAPHDAIRRKEKTHFRDGIVLPFVPLNQFGRISLNVQQRKEKAFIVCKTE